MADTPDYPVLPFETQEDFRKWLEINHTKVPGIWLKMYKKDTGIHSINYQEALREALCFGWIDGQSKKGDDEYYVQKFTPRRPRSMWSKRNRDIVAELIKDGLMMSAGQAQIDAAKADGRWESAYDSPSNMFVPDDFLKELAKHKKAEAFYNTLNRANTYAIAYNLNTAKKPETRERRFNKFLEMMKKGEKIH
jgi:uncharacterized protein YdeI (YjbR/CyaY-like superfamily)